MHSAHVATHMPNFGILVPSELKGFSFSYCCFITGRVAACATAYHRPLPLFTHMDSIHCRTERGKERRGSEKNGERPQPTILILIICRVINTPRKNRHQLFVDFVRRFCRLFSSPDWKSCLSADQSADILGSGNVRAADGQMDRGRCSRGNNAGIQPTRETGNLDLLGKSFRVRLKFISYPGNHRPNKPELSVGYKSG